MRHRINKYDNLKGIAIFLIVLGHILSLKEFSSAIFIHSFISIIDLPIFFFVAGYFSKIGPDEPIKAFKRLLIPYILFSIMYAICMHLIKSDVGVLFIQTPFALWFLVALFSMKIFLPIFDKFKFPIMTSFILALLIGFINIDPNLLGITRFFAFLPIYLAGFYYETYKSKFENYYQKINKILNKSSLIIFGILTIICCLIVTCIFPTKIIILAEPYDAPFDLIRRAIILILSIIGTLILNKVCTNNQIIFTKIGENSYAVYLLHIYFVSLLNSYFFKWLLPTNEYIFLIFSVITSAMLVFILSRDTITKIFNKMIDFTCKIIINDKPS